MSGEKVYCKKCGGSAYKFCTCRDVSESPESTGSLAESIGEVKALMDNSLPSFGDLPVMESPHLPPNKIVVLVGSEMYKRLKECE